ncbi:MAG TPA: response regulator transcription factor [Methylophilaceae bacterium]|nr:response regulator transcription factor [Methylophilaceae bacterium]
MADYFISSRNALLANWKEAFPKASAEPSATFKTGRDKEPVFWVHSELDHSDWVATTIKKIFELHTNPKIIVLANSPLLADALSLFNLGVLGYCHAYTSAEMLSEVKTVVIHGGIWLGRDFLQHLIVKTSALTGNQPKEVSKALKLLTRREREVAIQTTRGLSNKEIARALKITERTVKAHLSHAFERLGVKDRLQLALMLSERNKR